MRLITDDEYAALMKSNKYETSSKPTDKCLQAQQILHDKTPDDVKLALYMQLMKTIQSSLEDGSRRIFGAASIKSENSPNENNKQSAETNHEVAKAHKLGTDDILNNIPEKFRDRASSILEILQSHTDYIEWDNYGAVRFFGEEKAGSNITDLLNYVLRDSKWPAPPIGINRFVLICKSLNVPASFVRKDLREQFLMPGKQYDKVESNSDSVKRIPELKQQLFEGFKNWRNLYESDDTNAAGTSTPLTSRYKPAFSPIRPNPLDQSLFENDD